MGLVGVFATRNDWLAVWEAEEAKQPLMYTKAGHHPTSDIDCIDSAAKLRLGVADGSQMVACTSYLVTERGTSVKYRPTHRNDGTTVYGIDQLVNPASVLWTPGGTWRSCFIAGEVSTTGLVPEAVRLLERLRAKIKKRFVRHRAFWVGPEAEMLLLGGMRFTSAEQSPPEYDLSPER